MFAGDIGVPFTLLVAVPSLPARDDIDDCDDLCRVSHHDDLVAVLSHV